MNCNTMATHNFFFLFHLTWICIWWDGWHNGAHGNAMVIIAIEPTLWHQQLCHHLFLWHHIVIQHHTHARFMMSPKRWNHYNVHATGGGMMNKTTNGTIGIANVGNARVLRSDLMALITFFWKQPSIENDKDYDSKTTINNLFIYRFPSLHNFNIFVSLWGFCPARHVHVCRGGVQLCEANGKRMKLGDDERTTNIFTQKKKKHTSNHIRCRQITNILIFSYL